jgi:hypothetical protein
MPGFFLHALSHPTATGEHTGKPEGWETDYLDWARRSVTGQIVRARKKTPSSLLSNMEVIGFGAAAVHTPLSPFP